MRIFLLGGSGLVGKYFSERAVKNPKITEITVAGRSAEKAKEAASAIGEKANSVTADATDESQVARLVRDYDIFVNTSGPDYVVQPHTVKAAVKAGVDYCDVSCDAQAAEEVLSLDKKAKAAGMTAIIGIGWTPGLDNLMMKHIATKMDEVEMMHACLVWPVPEVVKGDTKNVVDELRSNGPYSASWETGMRCFSGQCKVYREGRWVVVDPSKNGVDLVDPFGEQLRAYPACAAEAITLPRFVQNMRGLSVLVSFCPFGLNELALQLAARIKSGEIDTKEAAVSFLEMPASDPKRWLSGSEKVSKDWSFWMTATGVKDGAKVRYTIYPSSEWMSTAGPLYLAAQKLLEGKVREHGVLPPEACFDPMPFMEEVASTVPGRPKDKKLFDERWERLE